MSVADALPYPTVSEESKRRAMGFVTGLLAASIGALCVVFARWGIQHGATTPSPIAD
jgi:hypothetical protein